LAEAVFSLICMSFDMPSTDNFVMCFKVDDFAACFAFSEKDSAAAAAAGGVKPEDSGLNLVELREMDANGNGEVTLTEWLAYLKGAHKRRGPLASKWIRYTLNRIERVVDLAAERRREREFEWESLQGIAKDIFQVQ